jgi:hypothetical protein
MLPSLIHTAELHGQNVCASRTSVATPPHDDPKLPLMSNEKHWPARVDAWRASGMSAQEFCKQRGYSATTLYWWSSQLKRAGVDAQRDQRMPLVRVVRKSETRR